MPHSYTHESKGGSDDMRHAKLLWPVLFPYRERQIKVWDRNGFRRQPAPTRPNADTASKHAVAASAGRAGRFG